MDGTRNLASKRDSGNQAPRSGIPDCENFKINSTFAVGNEGDPIRWNGRTAELRNTWNILKYGKYGIF